MKKILPIIAAITIFTLFSCGRSPEAKKAYIDSLFHVIQCSPTIVAGPYTLEDQLHACDLLMDELPAEKRNRLKIIKKGIEHKIEERDNPTISDDELIEEATDGEYEEDDETSYEDAE